MDKLLTESCRVNSARSAFFSYILSDWLLGVAFSRIRPNTVELIYCGSGLFSARSAAFVCMLIQRGKIVGHSSVLQNRKGALIH